MKLWFGQTISVFGNQIYYVAIPLAAALTLDATATQVGILSAAGRIPWLVIGLFAGVWVDRLRRRPVLIVADIARGMLLLAIPIAWSLDLLGIELLYVVALSIGTLGVFFDVAYHSYLPTLVSRERLVEGNSRLGMSDTLAQVSGPGIAGVIVQVLSGPLAILVDAISFFVSALSLQLINTSEPEPETDEVRRNFRAEIGKGLRFVFHNPILRAIVGGAGFITSRPRCF